jgi:hypothetical protein
MKKRKKSTWSQVQQSLSTLEKSELIQLVRQLFDLSDDVARFLVTRFHPDEDLDSRLTPYRTLIKEQFFPRHDGVASLDFTLAQKAIDNYRQASSDILGVLELQLDCIETATALMNQIGIGYAEFYEGLAGVLSNFASLLWQHPQLYSRFAGRIQEIRQKSGHVGYGYSDYAFETLYDLEINLGDEEL